MNLLKKCATRSYCINQILHKSTCNTIELDNINLSYRCLSYLTNNITSTNVLNNPNNLQGKKTTLNKKWYSSGKSVEKLPPLMDFPEIVWPSLIKSIRNFILSTFIIKPYFDHEFNLPDFVKGSKKALEVVSNKISEGNFKNMNGLVTEEIVPSLQRSISIMSLSQREQLAINMDDIYFSFPYQVQIGVMFKDEGGKAEKRFVEITMVYHTLRGLAAMRMRGEEPPLNMGMMPEYQQRICICNYRFIREFTKGVDSDWTVNLLNHFRPSDNVEQ